MAVVEALGGHVFVLAFPPSLLYVPHTTSHSHEPPTCKPLSLALFRGGIQAAQYYLLYVFVQEYIFHFLFKAKPDTILVGNHEVNI